MLADSESIVLLPPAAASDTGASSDHTVCFLPPGWESEKAATIWQ